MAVEALTFEPVEWSPALGGWLDKITGAERYKAGIIQRVQSGEFQALSIRADGAPVGLLVWSVEVEPMGSVIVINALSAAHVKGVDVTRAAMAFCAKMGGLVGAVALRAWTDRRGLVRKCERAGFKTRYVIEGFI